MCGRFTLHTPRDVLARRFDVDVSALELPERYNIAPTQPVLTVRIDATGARAAAPMRWGLVPPWAENQKTAQSMINARVESAAKSPAYRASFRRQRCLVLADGFYEWQPVAGRRAKTPWWISLASGEPFAFAGLWAEYRSQELFPTEPLLSCTILTAPANALVAPIHGRMPVILRPEHEAAWIDPARDDVAELQALLDPVPAEALAAHAVSTRVNSPRNDGPALIVAEHPPQLGF